MAFIFGTKFGLTIDGLFEAFGALFGDPKEFQRVLSSVAKEPYACLLYLDKYETLKECYRKYKAPDMTNLKVKLKF
ncbi:hypothetical protein RFI_37865 [Reticulomyxa filosa]|uniref:Uncharacterized protein n=1 Tax=Reticulomyxa filosa TaxID=46433 RepID=X6LE01_RETFI|nr:hypothetical protein RFI_37865 [Reticulomyxa filosa]|eukprot:ETN99605.1 hypothetical protein RFI_37865 [Reticulomyxa filosa]